MASVILNMRINEISFGIANIDICKPLDYEIRKFPEKIFLILGGSVFNFLAFLILWVIYSCTKDLKFMYIAAQSAAIAVLNMLPVKSLDGGELLNLFMERYYKDFEYGKKLCDFVSWIFLFLLAILGLFIIIKFGYGFSVILLILYLIYQKYI